MKETIEYQPTELAEILVDAFGNTEETFHVLNLILDLEDFRDMAEHLGLEYDFKKQYEWYLGRARFTAPREAIKGSGVHK